eukprot:3834002-Alexandrium_andersonii.AAC.1
MRQLRPILAATARTRHVQPRLPPPSLMTAMQLLIDAEAPSLHGLGAQAHSDELGARIDSGVAAPALPLRAPRSGLGTA